VTQLFFFFFKAQKLRILKYLKILQRRKNGKEQGNMNKLFPDKPLTLHMKSITIKKCLQRFNSPDCTSIIKQNIFIETRYGQK